VNGEDPVAGSFGQLAVAATARIALHRLTMGLMPMKVREVIRLLETHGWVEMRSKRVPLSRNARHHLVLADESR
jgi:hypothetical protein